jgi:hypothetical protein
MSDESAPPVEAPETPADPGVSSEQEQSTPDDWVTNILDDAPVQNPQSEPVVEPTAEPPAPENLAPEPPVAETPPAEPPAPEPPVAEEPVTPPPEPTPPEPEVTPEPTPAEQQAQLEQWRTNLSDAYQLSEDDADNLLRDPNKVLPQLAAKLYTDVYQEVVKNVFSQISQHLPQFVRDQIKQATETESQATSFYDQWPELKSHATMVNQASELYQKMNKDATFEDFVRDVGTQVWIAAGLSHAELLNKLADKSEAPPEPVEILPTSGMNPAPPAVAPAPSTEPDNIFTEMAEDIIREGI